MLKYFSFVDVLKIPDIAEVASNQFDLLPKHVDSVVAPYLFLLGLDIDRGIRIQACQHRTSDLQTVVGFRYVGLERSDPEWLANRNCSMSARIHSQKDPELASDMVRMSIEGSTESKFIAMCVQSMGKDGTVGIVKEDVDPAWQENLSVMRALRDIQIAVRGQLHPDEDMLDNESDPNVANFETITNQGGGNEDKD